MAAVALLSPWADAATKASAAPRRTCSVRSFVISANCSTATLLPAIASIRREARSLHPSSSDADGRLSSLGLLALTSTELLPRMLEVRFATAPTARRMCSSLLDAIDSSAASESSSPLDAALQRASADARRMLSSPLDVNGLRAAKACWLPEPARTHRMFVDARRTYSSPLDVRELTASTASRSPVPAAVQSLSAAPRQMCSSELCTRCKSRATEPGASGKAVSSLLPVRSMVGTSLWHIISSARAGFKSACRRRGPSGNSASQSSKVVAFSVHKSSSSSM
mmetsp:Transcript_68600/g.200724  ORF Transcript_68600/g.200724 Transcript_68600/m.200724 type:complete len:281 (-) Transcript_68600:256-1098(-)